MNNYESFRDRVTKIVGYAITKYMRDISVTCFVENLLFKGTSTVIKYNRINRVFKRLLELFKRLTTAGSRY